jgi:uncharacterized protein YjbI with pentapeptide repeats
MADPVDPTVLLDDGVDGWNAWRRENRSERPDLTGIDLSDRDLTEIDFSELDLTGADLYGADLTRANMKMATLKEADLSDCVMADIDLYKAELSGCFLTGADLRGSYLAESNLDSVDLRGANLVGADLRGASLRAANLSHADLSGATLDDAVVLGSDFSHAVFSEASLFGMDYGTWRSMEGRYFAVRGLESCYGNAIFVRDAQDQDYLDTLQRSAENLPEGRARRMRLLLLRAWKLIDYGRSLAKPAALALLLSMLFGVLYTFDQRLDWELMDYSGSSESWLTPFYYSLVTYTTLGFGDITPQHWLGETIVIVEVLLGYTTLGLLLTILANSVARRS